MGLLDDAIREHLELKRRAGGDAMDVARQEREVLGPGGGGDPLTVPAGPDEPDYAEPQVHDPARPDPYDEQVDPGPYDDGADDYFEEPSDAPPVPIPPPAPLTPPAPMPAPPPPVEAVPQPPSVEVVPPPGPATEEYRIPPAATEPEDVLEQTPDFLEETPEHDRLWFEQAPPQEFDFDK